MTDPKNPVQPTGLPADTGDNLSERSGYYDESERGETDTSLGRAIPTGADRPTDTLDSDGSGTTFDGGSAIPR